MNVRPSAIIFKDNTILTLRYCYGGQEVFGLPGGNPDPGECLTDALARELHEELGIEAQIGAMVFCGEVIWQEINKETLHMVFHAKVAAGIPALNPIHTTALEIAWIPVNQVESKLLYPNVGKQIVGLFNKALKDVHIGRIPQPYIP